MFVTAEQGKGDEQKSNANTYRAVETADIQFHSETLKHTRILLLLCVIYAARRVHALI